MIRRKLLILILAVSTIQMFGQNILNSPYSRFGFGDFDDQNYMTIRQMGGLGSSWVSPNHINFTNPASLTHLTSTAYEVGVSATRATLDDGINPTEQWGGKFNYIGIAFPLFNPINDVYEDRKREIKYGMGFNLSRRNTVGYNITSVDSTEELGVFTRNYNGSGGTYEFNWSNAVSYKEFSFGLTLGYLFGNATYNRSIVFNQKEFPFNDEFTDSYFVRGFTYNLGFIYQKVLGDVEEVGIDKLKKITIGVRFSNGNRFTAIGDETALAIQRLSAGLLIRDTISIASDIRGKGFLPGTLGIGANYKLGSKFGIGLELNTAAWSRYYHELKGDVKDELRNSLYVSLGGFYRPDYKSYNNYLKRISYMYGAFYEQDPRRVNGVDVNAYGFRLGLELPFSYQRRGSSATLGVEFGNRGSGTIIEENYLNINFGFTFNDGEWFIKRKYN